MKDKQIDGKEKIMVWKVCQWLVRKQKRAREKRTANVVEGRDPSKEERFDQITDYCRTTNERK